ncbi:MAG: hypothetical protein MR681_03735, partial [Prevotella sp.]|nr:hypothetical protein [Prevotella sp.]
MKRNKQTRNAIDTFFFHCERVYTVKEKSREWLFALRATRCVLREPTAFPFHRLNHLFIHTVIIESTYEIKIL